MVKTCTRQWCTYTKQHTSQTGVYLSCTKLHNTTTGTWLTTDCFTVTSCTKTKKSSTIHFQCFDTTNHHHNRFTAPFLGPSGRDSARRELQDFMVQGKTNRGRHTNHPYGRHSIRTNQCPPPPSPHIFIGRMPFLSPNQQCQSTEDN